MDHRTLVAVVAGGNERLTDRSLESVARLASAEVDVMVFDEDGDGRERAGLTFYRSPRSLGVARTMNVAFLHALSARYVAVLHCEPNVTVPADVVTALNEIAGAGGRFASVAASSVTGLEQDVVDWLPSALTHSPAPVDVPAAVGPCVLFPTAALRDVGLFDPIYVSGHDHAMDWSQRATGLGFRCVTAPGVYVSVFGEPVPAPPAGAIVRFRHPSYKPAPESGTVAAAAREAAYGVVVAAAGRFGYTLEVGWQTSVPADDDTGVRVIVEPDGERPVVSGHFCGFSASLSIDRADDVATAIADLLGGEPRKVIISEQGPYATQIAASAPHAARFMYPKRV